MPKRKRKNNLLTVTLTLVLILIAVALARNYASGRVLSGFTENTVELDNIDLKYDPNPTLYFSKDCSGIKMGVTNDQAFSIREALTRNMFTRPLTHDLMIDVLNSFRVKLVYAKIDDIKDGIYTAKLLFYDGATLHEADARPSDMASLTLRFGNSFSISNRLLSNMTNIC
ncbi:MAG: bifunctional nuclease family protein [Candidatus Aenigmarchaeota archaeon]|nr:bifunctional nuclease family protein [Candidatus Aenigmarchaeota archaeon]